MGRGIARQAALDHPDRVASLTLISTSPGTPDLPPMSDRLRAVFSEPPPEPVWSDLAAVIAYMIEGERPFAGSLPVDEVCWSDGRSRPRARRTDSAPAQRLT